MKMKDLILLSVILWLCGLTGANAQGPQFPEHLITHIERGESLDSGRAPNCDNRAIRVTGRVEKNTGDGVLVSQGGAINGWAVYLKDGKLTAAVRRSRKLFTVRAGDAAPGDGFEFQFGIGSKGVLTLFQDGAQVARGKMPGPMTGKPGDPLLVGEDSLAPVGEYKTPFRFAGTISGVAVAVAALPRKSDDVYGSQRTRWADQVDSNAPWPEYPRPQMVRAKGKTLQWTNLNGRWDYAIKPKSVDHGPWVLDATKWGGKILVPFAVESRLSGVQRPVGSENRLWYRRSFDRPRGERVLLHFGAVDWHAVVIVNGKKAGEHKGGYDPFTFDITSALKKKENELVVSVWDPTDTQAQPRGKQVSDPRGIWYTSVTGIWQTVWLEGVPEASIARLVPVPDVDAGKLRLSVEARGLEGKSYRVRAIVSDGDKEIARADGEAGAELSLPIDDAKLWSPSDPHLYDLGVELIDGKGAVVDRVQSYFGMRKIALGKDTNGNRRLFLNNEPLFQYGPLDQGWWPDGLYTPPTEEAMVHDLKVTQELGFNMVRKHVKVECARWYYHCDKMGLLVWQDMPTGNRHPTHDDRVAAEDPEDWKRPADTAAQWEREYKAVMRMTHPFPSVIMYVPHNEGWGQFDTLRIAKLTKRLDPTRLVNEVSGWTLRGGGDVIDLHIYPGPGMEPAAQNPGRAVVLGEFGGLGLPLTEHLWWADKRNWGYRTYQSKDELFANYQKLLQNLRPMIHRGLAAAVYTQTTDVEGEVNGLMTYDREVTKFLPKQMRRLHDDLYATDMDIAAEILVADSEVAPQQWHAMTREPGDGWKLPGFKDGDWKEVEAPAQDGSLFHLPKGWKWSGEKLWLRKAFVLQEVPEAVNLKLYSGANTRVFLNGRPVLEESHQAKRHYTHYALHDAAGVLRKGKNVLAIEAAKASDSVGVDAGLYGYPHLPAKKRTGKPNVLFIFIDDMGYGDLSITGNKDVLTPNIDRIGKEGMLLSQFYVASPICSPSRVGVTTGQFPARWRINSYLNRRERNAEREMADFLDPQAPALARVFHDAGYATAHFGKWHMGGGRDVDDAPFPQAYGFDESLVAFEGLGDRLLMNAKALERAKELGRGQLRQVDKHEKTSIYVDRAIDFMRRRAHEGNPFYLHLWCNDVHDAHVPHPAQLEKWTPASTNPYVQKFYAVLDEMDRQVGRLLAFLDESGRAENTIVVLTSDNGPTAWPRYYKDGVEPPGSTAGDRGRKWSLYEGGIRMPLLARWPGKIPAGVENRSLVGAVDLFPTFCALAGVQPPEASFDGQDMSAVLLKNKTVTRKKPLFWEYGRDDTYLRPGAEHDISPNLAMRAGDWKLLVNADGSDVELYNLRNDPVEANNLAAKEPERAERMRKALLKWRRSLP